MGLAAGNPKPRMCNLHREGKKKRGYGGMRKEFFTKSVSGNVKNTPKKKLLTWLQNIYKNTGIFLAG